LKNRESKTENHLNVLFTCIGRRVSLLESFRRAAKQLKINASLLGTDTTELSPALQLCDKRFGVKPTTHAGYIKQILSIVKANNVKLLVPTVDLDLKRLAQNKPKFAALGCRVLVSDPQVIDICQDKRKTYKFLLKNNFDTPATVSIQTALRNRKCGEGILPLFSTIGKMPTGRKAGTASPLSEIGFPLFLKRWDGSAGRGNAVVNNREELLFYSKRIPNPICQEFVEGTEYTCDAYIDFGMKVRCVVPRKRIEVRAGEVSKGQTAKNAHIMSEATTLVEKLGAGPGVITLQLFLTDGGKIKYIEINPRFGGGAPLSIKAGADFPKWILQELAGRKPNIRPDGFKDGLIMLRYDSEVWLDA
jgi:carbamoyl-phosphate synthase large subunit